MWCVNPDVNAAFFNGWELKLLSRPRFVDRVAACRGKVPDLPDRKGRQTLESGGAGTRSYK